MEPTTHDTSAGSYFSFWRAGTNQIPSVCSHAVNAVLEYHRGALPAPDGRNGLGTNERVFSAAGILETP